MNRNLWLFIMLFFSISAFAQKSELKGVIIDFGTGSPVVGAKVSLKVKNVSVPSVKNGKFIFKNLSPGTDELIIESPGYQIFTQNILIKEGEKIKTSIREVLKQNYPNAENMTWGIVGSPVEMTFDEYVKYMEEENRKWVESNKVDLAK